MDLNCGEFLDAPNDQYKKFFLKFKEIKDLPLDNWKPVHILAYFCSKYKQHYNHEYKFKFNSPKPTSCFEIFQVKKLAQLLSAHPKILRDYIDWVFQTRVVAAKRKLTSISFLTVEALVFDYKTILFNGQPQDSSKLDRSTILSPEFVDIFNKININIKTFGDLAFIYQIPNKTQVIQEAFDKCYQLGLEKDILEKIK
jgi:hypothetical protein